MTGGGVARIKVTLEARHRKTPRVNESQGKIGGDTDLSAPVSPTVLSEGKGEGGLRKNWGLYNSSGWRSLPAKGVRWDNRGSWNYQLGNKSNLTGTLSQQSGVI